MSKIKIDESITGMSDVTSISVMMHRRIMHLAGYNQTMMLSITVFFFMSAVITVRTISLIYKRKGFTKIVSLALYF